MVMRSSTKPYCPANDVRTETPSGKSTNRRQDLGNSLTAGQSQGHIESGSIDTSPATMLAVHTRRDRSRQVEAAVVAAPHRPLAV